MKIVLSALKAFYHLSPASVSALRSSKTFNASSAALTPERAMAPKVGPIRLAPSTSDNSCGRQYVSTTLATKTYHATDDETRYHLTSTLDDGILGSIHVKATHATESRECLHAHETLGGKGAKWAFSMSAELSSNIYALTVVAGG